MGGEFLAAPLRPQLPDLPAPVAVAVSPVATGYADRWSAADTYPELTPWRSILDLVGIEPTAAIRIAARARYQRTTFEAELIASGTVKEGTLYEAVATALGVPYAAVIDPDRLILRDEECEAMLTSASAYRQVSIDDVGALKVYAVAPSGPSLARLHQILRRVPQERDRIWIVAPSTMRAALLTGFRATLASRARNGLFERLPDMSARFVANAWQGGMVGAAIVLLPLLFIWFPHITYSVLHAFFTLFFLACVGLRFAAIRSPPRMQPPDFSGVALGSLPTYAVLVALHREADVVPQLLKALDALVWPRSKLHIKLVCEADDKATLTAISAHDLPPHIEVLEVPPGQPRTKPKALAYALQIVTSDFIVLYDAEDRPHPMQLVEAWLGFEGASSKLACLQAPLDVTNARAGLIARMFAFEYCGLFRGLLPWLSARQLVMPLGGTSNHFRRAALEDVGGWDPYNVTEDADLGIRLRRFGYRTGTITLPTFEDGPETFGIWLPQRTRWFKGWLQSWLVHMRAPGTLYRQLGFKSFCIAQILSAGLVLSALVHPILVATAIYLAVHLAIGNAPGVWQSSLLIVDLVNIACGYVAFLLLGWQPLRRQERRGFWRIVLFTPVYWVMLSIAAWRAVYQLWKRPYQWEKTPHFRVADATEPLLATEPPATAAALQPAG